MCANVCTSSGKETFLPVAWSSQTTMNDFFCVCVRVCAILDLVLLSLLSAHRPKTFPLVPACYIMFFSTGTHLSVFHFSPSGYTEHVCGLLVNLLQYCASKINETGYNRCESTSSRCVQCFHTGMGHEVSIIFSIKLPVYRK